MDDFRHRWKSVIMHHNHWTQCCLVDMYKLRLWLCSIINIRSWRQGGFLVRDMGCWLEWGGGKHRKDRPIKRIRNFYYDIVRFGLATNHSLKWTGGTENVGQENAGLEFRGQLCRAGKYRTGKCRSGKEILYEIQTSSPIPNQLHFVSNFGSAAALACRIKHTRNPHIYLSLTRPIHVVWANLLHLGTTTTFLIFFQGLWKSSFVIITCQQSLIIDTRQR